VTENDALECGLFLDTCAYMRGVKGFSGIWDLLKKMWDFSNKNIGIWDLSIHLGHLGCGISQNGMGCGISQKQNWDF